MTVGCLGAGQLGQMLAHAGRPMGIDLRFFDGPSPNGEPPPPGAQVGPFTSGSFTDERALLAFARSVELMTYEFENVPVAAARAVEKVCPVLPGPRSLEVSQDRVAEKDFFRSLNIPTPEFRAIGSRDEFDAALEAVGAPCVIKTRRLGYDGKGQVVVRTPADADTAWDSLSRAGLSRNDAAGAGLIAEAYVPFVRELSILAVRSTSGETRFYPPVQNRHEKGILRESIAPAPLLADETRLLAESHARRALESLNYAGVLCMEFFETRDANDAPTLLANETACRVHNSGHWTIEGAKTSQFENHLRAILGKPLGDTGMFAPGGCAAMLNIIGDAPSLEQREAVLALEGAHVHLYGKNPREGRKLGHVTVIAPDAGTLAMRIAAARSALAR